MGVVLYEILSGQRAFPGKNPREVVVSVLVRSLPPLRSLRPETPLVVDRIVARAMERDRSCRYASAAELQHDLLEARAALGSGRLRGIQTGRHSIVSDEESSDIWDAPTRQLRRASGMR